MALNGSLGSATGEPSPQENGKKGLEVVRSKDNKKDDAA